MVEKTELNEHKAFSLLQGMSKNLICADTLQEVDAAWGII
jgi:hypothetical protein